MRFELPNRFTVGLADVGTTAGSRRVSNALPVCGVLERNYKGQDHLRMKSTENVLTRSHEKIPLARSANKMCHKKCSRVVGAYMTHMCGLSRRAENERRVLA